MSLYTYVVARDFGFAPNPFFGYCTLATCKPVIRRCAQVGDWVAGTGSADHGMSTKLIYAMRVGEVLTFDQYWNDFRFRRKRPNLRGSIKQAFGDNIYHRDANESWCQERSHHSHKHGPNGANLTKDTRADSVLVSSWFVYFGANAIDIPAQFRGGKGETIVCGRQGHRSKFRPAFEEEFVKWVRTQGDGLMGEPVDFRAQLTWRAA
jgi:hypothetical protein